MRDRSRALLIAAATLLGGACSVDDSGNARSITPRAEAREYCALVERFYGRLDEFVGRAQEDLGPDADQSELDQRLVGFIRENQDLFERLAAVAPGAIAADAATQAAAFEQVAVQGTLAPLETPAAKAAESRTVEYEEEECGITVE
ncbi:MAG: hypothetical protein ACT4PI_16715 [Actinomycetota bacterium]